MAITNLFVPKPESYFEAQGAKRALALFHSAAERVPAYKDFLRKHRIDHRKVKNMDDFVSVPVTSAKNYINEYSVEKRCWDGRLAGTRFVATSSGTKGEPKFWPRNAEQDVEAAAVHDFLYRTYFTIDKRSTLLLIGFPMGIYISGVATLIPSWIVSQKGYDLTVMSVGNNKTELLRTVRHLSKAYDQTILVGHPFFIKDVIETGTAEGIRWADNHLGLMFCSGAYTEAWRDYVMKKAGIPGQSMRVFNTYGSSEMLLMGYETPWSIAVKRLAERSPKFLEALTGDLVPPQFFQYHPMLRYIESVDKELVFTSASGLPLVRYEIHDRGEVIPVSRIEALARAEGKSALALKPAYRLPVVTLWGRSDDAIKFHGVNIYAEQVKAGLADRRLLRLLTGKFVVRKYIGKSMDLAWEVNIELTQGARPFKKLERDLQARITDAMKKVSLEYADMAIHVKQDVRPKIVLWPYQHLKYFKPGLKPRFIERTGI